MLKKNSQNQKENWDKRMEITKARAQCSSQNVMSAEVTRYSTARHFSENEREEF